MKKLLCLLLTGFMVFGLANYSDAATKLKVSNDVTGAIEEVQGSDGRLNVSSRSDTRSFYSSRDDEQAYVLYIEDDNARLG